MIVVEMKVDDEVIDTVSLIDGRLKYDTGRAESTFEMIRRHARNKSNANLFRLMGDGWSNGYVVTKRRTK